MIFSTRMDKTQADNWMDLAFTLKTDSMTAHHCVEAAYQSFTHDACNHCQTEILLEGAAASNPLADFNPRLVGDQNSSSLYHLSLDTKRPLQWLQPLGILLPL